MPKIRIEGYEFFFYSNEGNEAPHVHIYIDGSELKFWLTDVVLATQNPHVGAHKINRIAKVIRRHKNMFLGFWHDHHSRQ